MPDAPRITEPNAGAAAVPPHYPGRVPEDFRALAARWTITMTLATTGAAMIGSHEADNCDVTFARTIDGKALLPGTTLTGALRSALADRLMGYREREERGGEAWDTDNRVARLFGSRILSQENRERAEANGNRPFARESAVIVFDAVAENETGTSIRDGVRIDPRTGRAADALKYDRELSLPGLRFPVRFDLLVPGPDEEETLLADLTAALKALEDGDVRLGARRTRGLGACAVSDFRARRYDLKTGDGWRAYAASEAGDNGTHPLADREPEEALEEALARAASEARIALNFGGAGGDRRKRLEVALRLEVDGSLLIRSPGQRADDPDVIHLTEAGRAVVSGTALAGALRSRAVRIENTMAGASEPGLSESSVTSSLFGPSPEEGRRTGKLRASKVLFSEATLSAGGVPLRQSRVQIDRFTGGPVDGALFDEEPRFGGSFGVTVTGRALDDAEIGLLLLAARDLVEGMLPVGGEASIGRGVLRGTAEVRLRGGDGEATSMGTLGGDGESSALTGAQIDALNHYAAALASKVREGRAA